MLVKHFALRFLFFSFFFSPAAAAAVVAHNAPPKNEIKRARQLRKVVPFRLSHIWVRSAKFPPSQVDSFWLAVAIMTSATWLMMD